MKNYRIMVILGLVLVLLMVSACGDMPADTAAEPMADEAIEAEPVAAEAEEDEEEMEAAEADEEQAVENETTFGSEEGDLVFSGFGGTKIDPAVTTDPEVLTVSRYVYSRLVEMVDGEVVPGLATSWSVSDDGLTHTFQLRPNAEFTDGTKVTSDVILANFNRWFDPENPLHGTDSEAYAAWKANFDGFRGEITEEEAPISNFDGIEKVDNLVFLIHLNVPMNNFVEVITGPEFSIMNPIMLASEGGDHATIAGSVVGTGQYEVAAWDEKGLSLVFSETYWGD